MEMIIWDNASEDNTISMVKEIYNEMNHEGWFNLALIEWDRNEGSYIPYNLALRNFHKRTEFILGLDADVELTRNALVSLVSAAQEDRVAVVGARSVYYDESELTSHGAGFISYLTARYSERDPKFKIDCDFVIGCCWLLNKRIFKELNGFDSDYYINHWEVDYCLRAKKAGYKIVYEPAAVVKHKIPYRGTLTEDRLYYLYRNKLIFIKKNFPLPQKWISLLLHSISWIVRTVIETIANRNFKKTIIIRALMDGWLNRTGKKI